MYAEKETGFQELGIERLSDYQPLEDEWLIGQAKWWELLPLFPYIDNIEINGVSL